MKLKVKLQDNQGFFLANDNEQTPELQAQTRLTRS
jgi:hypothetical protein